jgi:antitoxin component of MazEF toxin-antitoxin module
LGLSNYIVPMLTKIVPIGNSRGIRIPQGDAGDLRFLGEEVELQAKNGALILRPVNTRAGRVVGGLCAGMAAAQG